MAPDFLPSVQGVLNKVQITVLNKFIKSNFLKNKGSTLSPFLYYVEYTTYQMAETAYLNKLCHNTASTTA